jgi:hypothetical protein
VAVGKERRRQWVEDVFLGLNNNGAYRAATALFFDKANAAVRSLRLWPEQVPEFARQLQPRGKLFRLVGMKKGKTGNSLAARVVDAVLSAVHGNVALKVANVHLCGEGCAGKTMTRVALMKCFDKPATFRLMKALSDIPIMTRRTLGMEFVAQKRVVEISGCGREPLHLLYHDYGGQEEFRANHAAHLAAPNSVYLLVVPLWNPKTNQPMDLVDAVEKYRNWLKLINTVASKSGTAKCITVLNFARQYMEARLDIDEVTDLVLDAQNAFRDTPRLEFVGSPLLVNSNIPASVRDELLPVLMCTVDEMTSDPVAIAPALQTALTAMQAESSWPTFCPESEVKKRLFEELDSIYRPSADLLSDNALANQVVDTIVDITQSQLESRRDIVMLPVQGGERISINRPNWLTKELLGSLFTPKGLDAPMTADDVPQYVWTAEQIGQAAVKSSKMVQYMECTLQPAMYAKLLTSIGVCIPIARRCLDDGSYSWTTVGENQDLAGVEFYFPALYEELMPLDKGGRTSNAAAYVTRRYKVKNPTVSMIPPGYYAALFAEVVGLYPTSNLIWLYKNGMVLEMADGPRIVVRGSSDDTSFDVDVEIADPSYDLSSAFEELEKVRQLVVASTVEWRRNVTLVEIGLHPDHRDRTMYIAELQEKVVRKEKIAKEHRAFYYGKESHHLPLHLKRVKDELRRKSTFLSEKSFEWVWRSAVDVVDGDGSIAPTEVSALRAEVAKLTNTVQRHTHEIAATKNIVENTILQIYHFPYLAQLVPAEDKGTVKDSARQLVTEAFRLHFYCPVCKKRARAGQNGKGYHVRITHEWVKNAASGLKVAATTLQILSLVSGLPIPRVGEILQTLPVTESFGATKAVQSLRDAAAELANAKSGTTKRVTQWENVDGNEFVPPVIEPGHIDAVKNLLDMVEDNYPPKLSGLVKVVRQSTQECAWVCAGACRDDFLRQGYESFKFDVKTRYY